jgi:hypothetical protein
MEQLRLLLTRSRKRKGCHPSRRLTLLIDAGRNAERKNTPMQDTCTGSSELVCGTGTGKSRLLDRFSDEYGTVFDITLSLRAHIWNHSSRRGQGTEMINRVGSKRTQHRVADSNHKLGLGKTAVEATATEVILSALILEMRHEAQIWCSWCFLLTRRTKLASTKRVTLIAGRLPNYEYVVAKLAFLGITLFIGLHLKKPIVSLASSRLGVTARFHVDAHTVSRIFSTYRETGRKGPAAHLAARLHSEHRRVGRAGEVEPCFSNRILCEIGGVKSRVCPGAICLPTTQPMYGLDTGRFPSWTGLCFSLALKADLATRTTDS